MLDQEIKENDNPKFFDTFHNMLCEDLTAASIWQKYIS